MRALWIEEREKHVWHRSVGRIGPLTYRAACGWRMGIRDSRVWPITGSDPGPAPPQRCHACVAAADGT